MSVIPNATVPLVDQNGAPGKALMALVPSLSIADAVVDKQGLATPLLRVRLHAMGAKLPNPSVPLVNQDGTPTRVFSLLLAGLP